MVCARLLKHHKSPFSISRNSIDVHFYIQVLDACIQSKSLNEGKRIHQTIIKNRSTNVNNSILLDRLTIFYITCNEVELARRVFDKIPNPSVVLWNKMIRAYAWNGPFNEAIDLYYQMIESGVRPTKFTFPFVFKACSGLYALDDGKEIHEHAMRLGLDSDVFVCTALIDLYAKCGSLLDAQSVFDKMPYRDVVAWNAMIAGFSLHGIYDDVVTLVVKMQEAGMR